MFRFLLFVFIVLAVADPAMAQSMTLKLGDDKTPLFTSKVIQFVGLITLLSVAPSILIMVTSFTRVVIVFSFLRTALGLQQTPPNSVIISLALFLTMFIMAPVFEQSYNHGIKPLMNEEIEEGEAFTKISDPFKSFMLEHVREKDLSLFLEIAKIEVKEKKDVPLHLIIPAFMISELKRAFEIGFLIFLPFLIIDMLVASILMAMGMMMIPPVMVSLPFKLIFFVLIDGWYMICGSLIKSYIL
ncbi:MAG: flagellar type III secretion system pore protein FliP [Candidatus Jidaibacter sp.]|nr:flagellar type III secretion system pore protein FliP [Candidatus Jidaibacter sp.]